MGGIEQGKEKESEKQGKERGKICRGEGAKPPTASQ